jgi:aquaporin Z
MRKMLAEFIGTFFLVLVVALTGNPLAIGVALAIMIYSLTHVSGAHFNPAVTIALLISKNIDLKESLKYIVSQFAGALAAAFAAKLIMNKMFLPGIGEGITAIDATLVEVLFTFALVFVIFNVAVNEKTKGNQYFGLAIGLVIFVAATAGGAISGGAFNPAVGIAPLLLDLENISNHFHSIILYLIAPVVGAVAATIAYQIIEKEN